MKRFLRPTAAFSLVEVTLALGIMAFCLVALFGLLPVGFNNDQISTEQTAAAGVAAALVADLRQTAAAQAGATPDPPQSPRFQISVPYKASQLLVYTLFLTEDGAVADANADTSPPTSAQNKDADPTKTPRYRATVVYTLPANPGMDRTATVARVLVTWPALADAAGGALPQHFSGSFETVTALDRN